MPYLRDSNAHDFGHVINDFRFAADAEAQGTKAKSKEVATRAKLGIKDPLHGVQAHTEQCERDLQCTGISS